MSFAGSKSDWLASIALLQTRSLGKSEVRVRSRYAAEVQRRRIPWPITFVKVA